MTPTSVYRIAPLVAACTTLFAPAPPATAGPERAMLSHTSQRFAGAKANAGTVTHAVTDDGRNILTLSADFVVPDTPAPHWQIVDGDGQVFLLNRLVVKGEKGDRLNRSITVPDYVESISRVQIWCAWAETVLGETRFGTVLDLRAPTDGARTGAFTGPKADTGYVTHAHVGRRCVLTLSDDFVVPDTPAPHWRLVDSCGRTYLLNRLDIKGGRVNRTIDVPAYVPDVARVQIWCAWAEALLGEASFDRPVH